MGFGLDLNEGGLNTPGAGLQTGATNPWSQAAMESAHANADRRFEQNIEPVKQGVGALAGAIATYYGGPKAGMAARQTAMQATGDIANMTSTGRRQHAQKAFVSALTAGQEHVLDRLKNKVASAPEQPDMSEYQDAPMGDTSIESQDFQAA